LPTYRLGTNANTPILTTANFASLGGISNAQLGTANGLLSLLGGVVGGGVQSFNTTSRTSGFTNAQTFQDFRYNNYSLYLQDRYRVTSQLSLTLGVRYEIFTPLRLKNGLGLEATIPEGTDPVQALLNPAGTYQFIGGNAGSDDNRYYRTDKNTFAPALGFAYSPQFKNKLLGTVFGREGRTVIRGGFSQVFGNDSIVTSFSNITNSNVGLGRTASNALDPTGTTSIINARFSALPTINPPVFITPPRTFLQNNTPQFNRFGTAYAIDPDVQTPRVSQYSFGIQREFGFQTAVEIRYVGSRSSNLVRAIDYNQIDIRDNGFLADFNRARQNLILATAQNAAEAARGVPAANRTPLSGAFNANVAGGQTLQLFPRLPNGGNLADAANRTFLTNGTPADLALNYIQLGQNGGPTLANPTAPQFINFLANPAIGVADFYYNGGNYQYDSLQVEFRRRFAQGLAFQANYTFSKNLTNAIGTSQALFEPFLDNRNQNLDKARADYDQTHVFNFNNIYELPFGRGKRFFSGSNGFINKLIEGFQISTIVRWDSGVPVTFVDDRGTLNRSGRSARQTANSSLTNDEIRALTGVFDTTRGIFFINPSVLNVDPNVAGSGTGRASEGFGSAPFNGQVFFNVNPGETGNLQRTIINAPSRFNLDAALFKNISITEGTRLQLRFETFNTLNNVSFRPAAGCELQNINSAAFGQLT
ncbi:MAG: TonB-dependent receptor, partial [Acidobacteria bacterium]|nr:TonB-dependent receptor [Acidobacteriota bacterium]